MSKITTNIREYAEEMEVSILDGPRPVVEALNEAGYNCTDVDILDLLTWVKIHHPEWWDEA